MGDTMVEQCRQESKIASISVQETRVGPKGREEAGMGVKLRFLSSSSFIASEVVPTAVVSLQA
eukprot:606172-Rhodomonas_salina.2